MKESEVKAGQYYIHKNDGDVIQVVSISKRNRQAKVSFRIITDPYKLWNIVGHKTGEVLHWGIEWVCESYAPASIYNTPLWKALNS